MNKTCSTALLLGALLATPAWAGGDRPIDERRPLKADARVSVSNVAGRIDVEAWDRNELHLTGELSKEVEELAITGGEASLTIEVKLPRRARNVGDTRLHLKVPAGITLDAEGVSADVTARGLRGPVELESVSGDVRVAGTSERVRASTVSGDVMVDAPATRTRVASVSGDVTVRGVRGEVGAETVSGDLRIEAGALRELDVESVSGDLDVMAELLAGAEVSVETLSGNVRLRVPALPDGELRMKTFSGELSSDLVTGLRGDAREFSQRGKGGGSVRLGSFSGDVELKKK